MSYRSLKLFVAGIAFVLTTSVNAGAPQLDGLTVSDSEFGVAIASFSPDTPRIFLHASLVDMPVGTRLSSAWIALDTQGAAPPNYKIHSADLTTGMSNGATFSVSKPADGWPAGSYLVDLFINGTAAYKVNFKVEAS